jgi:hypothetical protein
MSKMKSRSEVVLDELERMRQQRIQNKIEEENWKIDEQRKRPYLEAMGQIKSHAEIARYTDETFEELKNKLKIGMHYDQVIQILGLPTSESTGESEILGGSGPVIFTSSKGKSDTINTIMSTRFCYWDRPEASYNLTFTRGTLTSIYRIIPKNEQIILNRSQIEIVRAPKDLIDEAEEEFSGDLQRQLQRESLDMNYESTNRDSWQREASISQIRKIADDEWKKSGEYKRQKELDITAEKARKKIEEAERKKIANEIQNKIPKKENK